jgi:hypothetical protein
MPGTLGDYSLGKGGGSYGVLAIPHTARYRTAGGTFDWSTVTAEGSDRTLKDGTVVKAGDKCVEAGDVIYLMGSGKVGLATNATTLVRNETWILDRALVYSEPGSELTGNLLEGGNVWKARIRAGGAGQPTLANLLAALPMITFTESN